MRIITTLIVTTAALIGMVPVATAEGEASMEAVQKKLDSEFAITKTTDDKSDIVTAGSVIVLQKDKLLMIAATSSANPCPNTYKDGRLAPNAGCKTGDVLRRIPGFGSHIPGADRAPATRFFVNGEKFWVTKIEVKEAGRGPAVVMDFFSDAINDVRFKASLTIPISDRMSPDDALKLVQEVVKVAPSEDAQGDAKQPPIQGSQPPPPAPTAEAAPPPIAPPPPPPDADATSSATVTLGETPEQVVAVLGSPLKKAKVGARDIYFYKDLKVTFLNGKVKDIQ